MDPTEQLEKHGQLRLFDPNTLDPWKVACGQPIRVGRRVPLPTSPSELGRFPVKLRETEKLAERQEAA